ncbi:peptidase C15 [Microbacterium testaceum]|uniref:Pyrrolidone-carboxylate peptidase n=1 Tax=Microbacterium testaceum TaxID=2033 RepID=A0A147EXQ8_MICTE|nr:pyroglutamyl-peptidase I [Microbacterium testaceum]KTR94805.1 peptidase C15 [Microbacterium testaceum]
MTTVLLTGFEPFAGDATNPSGDAVRAVEERWTGTERLIVEVLPVAFDAAAARVRQLLAEHRPDVVIATGLAGGRAQVTPERVAINLADARIPDNDGAQPVDRPVVEGGQAAYFATLPVKAIAAALSDAGIPAAVSHSAGTFVCNHVMYTALDAAAPGVRAGFVHVPSARESAPEGAASLPLDDIVRALELTVRTALDVRDDPATPGGTLH